MAHDKRNSKIAGGTQQFSPPRCPQPRRYAEVGNDKHVAEQYEDGYREDKRQRIAQKKNECGKAVRKNHGRNERMYSYNYKPDDAKRFSIAELCFSDTPKIREAA